MKRLSAALLSLMLIVAACGDDDSGGDDPEAQAAIQGLRSAIAQSTADDPDAAFAIDDAAALCAAEGMFEQFGAARIVEASDMEFEDFMSSATADERRATVDLLFECIDVKAAIIAGMGDTEGVSDDSLTCLVDGMVGSEAFRDALAADLSGSDAGLDDAAMAEMLFPLIFECFSPEELAQLGSG